MTDTMTSQNIVLFSWDTLYNAYRHFLSAFQCYTFPMFENIFDFLCFVWIVSIAVFLIFTSYPIVFNNIILEVQKYRKEIQTRILNMLITYNMVIEVIYNNSKSHLERNLKYSFFKQSTQLRVTKPDFYFFVPTYFVSFFVTELFSLVFCGFRFGAVKIDWDFWTLHIRFFVPSPGE
jgi:hypothetical protein